jgi:beta-lactamase class A
LDISKRRGNVLLDRLQEALEQRLPQIEITRYMKPTFSKPAPDDLRQEIKTDNDFVVVALAD